MTSRIDDAVIPILSIPKMKKEHHHTIPQSSPLLLDPAQKPPWIQSKKIEFMGSQDGNAIRSKTHPMFHNSLRAGAFLSNDSKVIPDLI